MEVGPCSVASPKSTMHVSGMLTLAGVGPHQDAEGAGTPASMRVTDNYPPNSTETYDDGFTDSISTA